ncbi:hypothetical protein [Pantoea sp. SOD02]|uniref:hypothetical protein n=1 Tax=Pantoea sp. SOD02 TaxID=2970818 RepID=UPI0035BE68B1
MTINCIEELRHLAHKRVPKMFYDYIDAGSWTQSSYRAKAANCSALVAKRMWGRLAQIFFVCKSVAMNGDPTKTRQYFVGSPFMVTKRRFTDDYCPYKRQ